MESKLFIINEQGDAKEIGRIDQWQPSTTGKRITKMKFLIGKLYKKPIPKNIDNILGYTAIRNRDDFKFIPNEES